jgi:HPt (histidine-containing phosphotransfer) domain-containing protein
VTICNEPDDISGAMREIWDLNKPRVTSDILLVSRVVLALGDLQHAREAAHRLAGGLGVFGMNEAEHSARCIESILVKTQNEVGEEVGDVLFLIKKLEQEISTFDAKH